TQLSVHHVFIANQVLRCTLLHEDVDLLAVDEASSRTQSTFKDLNQSSFELEPSTSVPSWTICFLSSCPIRVPR
ncbi:hypothetical protein Csa_023650, partial [Cucumis sativus]